MRYREISYVILQAKLLYIYIYIYIYLSLNNTRYRIEILPLLRFVTDSTCYPLLRVYFRYYILTTL